MKRNKNQKVVVITGGTAGVGRACAREFAKHGYAVAVIARGKDRLQDTADELSKLTPNYLTLEADVADYPALEKAATKIESQLGPIDVWVNNAMTSVFAEFKDITPEEFKRVTEVTYLGVVYGTKVALNQMLTRNRGKIIQVGSALAYRSIPLQSAYCGAKHAIKGFTDSLRSELIHNQSQVELTMVQLPALNTPQFEWVLSKLPHKAQPVPPIFQPEVAAQAIRWAAEHQRRELFVGFPSLKAIIGDKLFPGLLDKYLAKTAYSGQQTSEKRDPDRPSNLFKPAPGDWEAHGRFNQRAQWESWYLWLATHRWLIWIALFSFLLVILYLLYLGVT